MIEVRNDGTKCSCLSTVQKDNMVLIYEDIRDSEPR